MILAGLGLNLAGVLLFRNHAAKEVATSMLFFSKHVAFPAGVSFFSAHRPLQAVGPSFFRA